MAGVNQVTVRCGFGDGECRLRLAVFLVRADGAWKLRENVSGNDQLYACPRHGIRGDIRMAPILEAADDGVTGIVV